MTRARLALAALLLAGCDGFVGEVKITPNLPEEQTTATTGTTTTTGTTATTATTTATTTEPPAFP